jgi:hypothetical protein
MTPEAIHAALVDGAMRRAGSALSEEQKVAVAEYVSGRKIGASMADGASKKCEGAAARFDLSERDFCRLGPRSRQHPFGPRARFRTGPRRTPAD